MNKKYLTSIAILIIFWFILYFIVQNEHILPSPISVFNLVYQDLFDKSFYINTFYTLIRVTIGLGIGITLALIFVVLSRYSNSFTVYFRPIITLSRSIPNISYLIVILVWFDRELVSILLVLTIIFPILYANYLVAFDAIPKELTKISSLFSTRKIRTIVLVEIPLIKFILFKYTLSAFSIALRVIIMSEILAQVRLGMGHDLNLARITVDMTRIFAESMWIAIISYIIDGILTKKISERIKLVDGHL